MKLYLEAAPWCVTSLYRMRKVYELLDSTWSGVMTRGRLSSVSMRLRMLLRYRKFCLSLLWCTYLHFNWDVLAMFNVQREYKESTNSNSPTGPNEAVCLAKLLLLYYLLDRDKRTAKWKAPPHPSLPLAEAGRKRKWYHVAWKNYHGICIGKW